ncbi:AAA family ATPase [Sorangium sp. So ce381]|uniref:AAA family ATPase n=1 Tax=Sorangium sp. So ce381 TaxID=3133307 RepID=UPI003F5C5738
MGIQKLSIAGFRSLRDVTWQPGRLNVVIGPNGSGKSNLLRALAVLQRSALGELPQEVLRWGGIGPLLWDGSAQEISWTVKTDPLGEARDRVKEALTYELRLRRLGGTSAYRIEHEQLANYHLKDIGQKAEPKKFLERRPGHAVMFDARERKLAAHDGSVPDDQTLLSLLAGPFGSAQVLGFRDVLSGWSIYHDVHVDQQAPLRQAAVARMERRIAADGQNLIPVLHTLYTGSRDFKRVVDDAMRAAFGQDYEELVFPPAADQRVQLRVRWRSLRTEQSAADLSDGTVRFLLLVAILASPSPADFIAIDEPEVGLHPSMLPIVAELAVDAAERSQVVFTTHSDQLLDAFAGEPPVTTVARWQDGETRLSIVDGDELRRWLDQYTLGALFRSRELEGMVWRSSSSSRATPRRRYLSS